MRTINTKEFKATLKSEGINVLRVLAYKGGVILTIDAAHALKCESYLQMKNIMCVRPMNAPIKAKANLLGYSNAAEFTSLFQL